MWPARNNPTQKIGEIAKECAKGNSKAHLSSDILRSLPQLESNHVKYENLMRRDKLSVSPNQFPLPLINSRDMIWLYTNRLSKQGRPARAIYDELQAQAIDQRCYYCNQQTVKTLDHFLPKSVFPTLSLEPLNLVPACQDCNKEQSNGYSNNPKESFFHPYSVPKLGRWLFAEVFFESRFKIRFFAKPSCNLPPDIQHRVLHQFSSLNLGSLYTTNHSNRLAEISANVARRNSADTQVIKTFLLNGSTDAFRIDENLPAGALYEALANCDEWMNEQAAKVRKKLGIASPVAVNV